MSNRIQIIVDIRLSEKHKADLDMLGIDYSTPFEAKIDEALSQMIDVLAKVLEPEDLPAIEITSPGRTRAPSQTARVFRRNLRYA